MRIRLPFAGLHLPQPRPLALVVAPTHITQELSSSLSQQRGMSDSPHCKSTP
jgi:hypothetical protein